MFESLPKHRGLPAARNTGCNSLRAGSPNSLSARSDSEADPAARDDGGVRRSLALTSRRLDEPPRGEPIQTEHALVIVEQIIHGAAAGWAGPPGCRAPAGEGDRGRSRRRRLRGLCRARAVTHDHVEGDGLDAAAVDALFDQVAAMVASGYMEKLEQEG